MRYAIVNNITSIVDNVVIWDGTSEFTPDGTLVQTDVGCRGDKYENSKFYRWEEETQSWSELV